MSNSFVILYICNKVWNRKNAKSVHQTRVATVADNFESHKNEVSDCAGSSHARLQWHKLQSRWSRDLLLLSNTGDLMNQRIVESRSTCCVWQPAVGGAGVQMWQYSAPSSLVSIWSPLYCIVTTLHQTHSSAFTSSPPTHRLLPTNLANKTGHASMTVQL